MQPWRSGIHWIHWLRVLWPIHPIIHFPGMNLMHPLGITCACMSARRQQSSIGNEFLHTKLFDIFQRNMKLFILELIIVAAVFAIVIGGNNAKPTNDGGNYFSRIYTWVLTTSSIHECQQHVVVSFLLSWSTKRYSILDDLERTPSFFDDLIKAGTACVQYGICLGGGGDALRCNKHAYGCTGRSR